MDRERFDALARVFATTGSRRSAIGALLGIGVLGTGLEAEARRGKSRNTNKGHGKGKGRDRKKRAQAEQLPHRCCSSGACIPGKRKDLRKCCFEHADLKDQNFTSSNLDHANLTHADATGANFNRANLGKACLVDTILTDATINNTTNLTGAIFCRTTMPDGFINNSGCHRDTQCCPTCVAIGDTGCDIGGECCGGGECAGNTCECPTGTNLCADGSCRECCDNGEQSNCDTGEVCCGFTCITGECCTRRQCDNPTPVCDNSNVCVACTANNQCGPNGVCTCDGGKLNNPEVGECLADQFRQGFENNVDGWYDWNNTADTWPGTHTKIVRVPSGTNGIPASSGGYYAQVATGNYTNANELTAMTLWGGYSSEFPAGGYDTSIDIYLAVGAAANTEFHYSSAINKPDCRYKNEAFFNGGTDANGQFCVNGGGGVSTDPCSAGRVVITDAGWYTFRHEFRVVSGVLQMTLKLLQNATLLGTWTENGPAGPVGGNRYGWFPRNQFSPLAIDNSRRSS